MINCLNYFFSLLLLNLYLKCFCLNLFLFFFLLNLHKTRVQTNGQFNLIICISLNFNFFKNKSGGERVNMRLNFMLFISNQVK